MVGPGRPIDTERYFVICPNVVGACMGTTGPSSIDPKTGKPWGLNFPVITIRDMVRAQAMLLDHLGIESLFAVAGGSMGGMKLTTTTQVSVDGVMQGPGARQDELDAFERHGWAHFDNEAGKVMWRRMRRSPGAFSRFTCPSRASKIRFPSCAG